MYKNRRQFARRRAAAFPHLESRHAEGIPLLVMLSVIRPKMENRIEKKKQIWNRAGLRRKLLYAGSFLKRPVAAFHSKASVREEKRPGRISQY